LAGAGAILSPSPPSFSDHYRRRGVDGVIIALPPSGEREIARCVESGFPCVAIDIDLFGNNVAFVMSDSVDGAVKIVHHLGGLGRKRIAFIGGRGYERPHVDRHLGFQSELDRLGLEYRPEYVATAHWLPKPAYAEMERMLSLPEPPDAVFCASDVMAIGAMAAIEDAGRRIPEDIAVAGFDDIDYARLVTPALTTVRQDRAKMAEAVMRSMLSLLARPDEPPPASILPVELIVRPSTTPRSSGSDALLI
jgi:LacI family transcriptional regulator